MLTSYVHNKANNAFGCIYVATYVFICWVDIFT